jgi:hypothetical protein
LRCESDTLTPWSANAGRGLARRRLDFGQSQWSIADFVDGRCREADQLPPRRIAPPHGALTPVARRRSGPTGADAARWSPSTIPHHFTGPPSSMSSNRRRRHAGPRAITGASSAYDVHIGDTTSCLNVPLGQPDLQSPARRPATNRATPRSKVSCL